MIFPWTTPRALINGLMKFSPHSPTASEFAGSEPRLISLSTMALTIPLCSPASIVLAIVAASGATSGTASTATPTPRVPIAPASTAPTAGNATPTVAIATAAETPITIPTLTEGGRPFHALVTADAADDTLETTLLASLETAWGRVDHQSCPVGSVMPSGLSLA